MEAQLTEDEIDELLGYDVSLRQLVTTCLQGEIIADRLVRYLRAKLQEFRSKEAEAKAKEGEGRGA